MSRNTEFSIHDFSLHSGLIPAAAGTDGLVVLQETPFDTVEVNLNVRLDNGRIRIDWDSGRLQSALKVEGPWFDLPAASSPWFIVPLEGGTFYRIKAH